MKFYMNGEENVDVSNSMTEAMKKLQLMHLNIQKLKSLYLIAMKEVSDANVLQQMRDAIDMEEKQFAENQRLGRETLEMILAMGFQIHE